jgi:UDP-glucuronate decarboxylase
MHPNDGRVVSNFIVQALKGRPITIFGEGKQTRSFCYVDDLIEAFIRLMHTPDDFTGPVNCGNPVEYNMLELAEKVIDLTGSKSKIEFQPLPMDDPKQRMPDISLAKKAINWEPRISLEEGLKRTISYFRRLLFGKTITCGYYEVSNIKDNKQKINQTGVRKSVDKKVEKLLLPI